MSKNQSEKWDPDGIRVQMFIERRQWHQLKAKGWRPFPSPVTGPDVWAKCRQRIREVCWGMPNIPRQKVSQLGQGE